MSRRALTTAAMVTGLALAGTLMAPAAAEAAAPASGARLVLTVRAPHTTLHAVLTCEPVGGNHPDAAAACTAIADAKGDLKALKADDAMCTMEYAPATATATGRWHGRSVHYRHKFGNACELHTATGVVFKF